jgi:hypothetical protein
MLGQIASASLAPAAAAAAVAMRPANDERPVPGLRLGLLLARRSQGFAIDLAAFGATGMRRRRLIWFPDDADVVAVWRAIAEEVGLPRFVETPDGAILSADPSRDPQPRRQSPLRGRRPRFRKRRAVQPMGAAPRASAG